MWASGAPEGLSPVLCEIREVRVRVQKLGSRGWWGRGLVPRISFISPALNFRDLRAEQ